MKLLWCDLETTGLFAENDMILEAAVVITDENLVELWSNQWVVYVPGVSAAIRDPKVIEMHTKNGLIEACRSEATSVHSFMIEEQLVKVIKHECEGERPMLAGSSVHFDRTFIRRHLPKVNELLHYRHFDVSVLQTGAEMWAPEMVFADGGPVAHRAMADVRHSLDKARHYKRKLFVA
jgi:oligoribonuclease